MCVFSDWRGDKNMQHLIQRIWQFTVNVFFGKNEFPGCPGDLVV